MPKLGMEGPLRQEINQAHKDSREQLYSKWKEIAQKYNRKYVGSGADCFVIEDEQKDKVFAINNFSEGVWETKRGFYSNKILKVLFPYNFPRIYASFEKGDDNIERVPGTVRERINGIQGSEQNLLKRTIRDLRTVGIIPSLLPYNQNKETGHNFSRAIKSLRDMGISMGFDMADLNLITDENKNEYYVDKVFMDPDFPTSSDKEKILNYMSKQNYNEHDTTVVIHTIDRMVQLNKEKREMSKEHPEKLA